MKKTTKIAIGAGVVGLSGISIFAILKQRKLAKQAFDAEFGEDEMTNDVESSALENDQVPEFTKYSGIPVSRVTNMLNEVTHKYNDEYNQYYITADDFEAVRKSLGVFQMFIRDNFSYFHDDENIFGEMITFRIREGYCVSNDGFFLINGKWTYLSKDDVLDDYYRCAHCEDRLYEINKCIIE